MATFRKRGKKWQAQVRLNGHDPLSQSFTRKSDAEAWAKKTEVELQNQPSDQADKPTLILSQLLDRYERDITPKKKARYSEKYLLRNLRSHSVASLELTQLTSEAICAYRDVRLKQVTPSSVRRELAVLQHCLEIAKREWGLLRENPVSHISKPSQGLARDRRIAESELVSLHNALGKSRNDLLAHVINFAMHTGMRRGEILSLTWQNVNLDKRTAHLPLTKNGESRTVPLSPQAIGILQDLRPVGQNGAVFPISPNAFRLAWERVKRRAGIEGLRFHDLRHEAISRFFEMGLSVPEVALISGHKDPRMLFRYTHLKAERVAEKLADRQPET